MSEADLKSALMSTFKQQWPEALVKRIEDYITAGIADIFVTHGITTWLEVKYANTALTSRGIQNHTMRRIAIVGSAWYVIYREHPVGKLTVLATPDEVFFKTWRQVPVQRTARGFDHKFVVDFVRKIHHGTGKI
jgi:hypothetical protein